MQSDDFGVICVIILWSLMAAFVGYWAASSGPQIIVRHTFNDSDCAQTNIPNIFLCEVKNEKPAE